MHARGHDGHMAMLLGLTDYIATHRQEMQHNIVLIFNPQKKSLAGRKCDPFWVVGTLQGTGNLWVSFMARLARRKSIFTTGALMAAK